VVSLGVASANWIGVPLTVEDETFGIMAVQTYSEDLELAQKELDLLAFVSTQTAMVIKRKQAEAAREHQLQELTALHAIASACAFASDEDTLLTVASIIIGEVLFPEDFGFFMIDNAGLLRPHPSYHQNNATTNEYVHFGEGLIGQAAQSGKARRSGDVRLEKSYVAASSTTLSELAVPVKINERILGVINAESNKLNAFSEADEHMLGTAADQIATALERIRLQNETLQRAKEFASLYETSNALSAENDLTSLLQVIVEHAATLLNTATGAIYLFNKSSQELETVVATSSNIPVGIHLRVGEGMAGLVAQNHQPMRIDDYSAWKGRSLKYESVAFHAILEVPMLFGGELIGVLAAAEMDESNRKFTEADERLLSLFAAQAAGAIHSARLRSETAQRAQEFSSLYETSKALSSEYKLNTLLRSIVENAKNLLNTATSGMYLVLPGNNELELSMDTAPYIPLGSPIKFGEGAAGRVAETRQPLRIDDYSIWEGQSKLYAGKPIRAVVEVPMLYRGELIGVLTADEAEDSERKFTENDERLLSLFASQAAGAIHAARLFEETRRRAEEFTTLYETTHDLAMQQDLSAVMDIITKRATRLLGVPNATIILIDPTLGDMKIAASIGPDLAVGTRRNISDGLAGRVAQSRSPLIIDDYQNWEHRSRLYDAIPYTAMMGVPLLYGGNLLGVLDVSDVAPSRRTFNEADVRLLSLFAGQAASAIANAQLFEDLKKSNIEILSSYDTTIEGWSRAMDLRDHETEGHTLRVTELTLKLARQMDLNEPELTHIRRGSLLHDIGKMGIPDAILLKEGSLSEEEWVIMRKHPQFAYEMLSSINYLHDALDIPSNHHEKWDGTGYPRGLKKEEIPLAARIFAVVDVWDAIRSDRPYRKGWDTEKAIDYIKSQSGTHFDPKVVDTFLNLLQGQLKI
jgi:putative nucleotidyltransferase with HDIG domain